MNRTAAYLAGSLVGLVLLLFIFYPMVYGVLRTFAGEGGLSLALYTDLFEGGLSSTLEATFNSIAVSLLTVALGAAAGLFLAVGLALPQFPARKLASALAVLPIAMPPLVGVIALMFVFGESGFLPRLAAMVTGLDPGVFSLSGFSGIVLVHAYSFHVYTYLFVSAALREIDGATLEAASILGAPPGRAFFTIVLPELVPALLGAASLTFMSSMASFSAPFLFGGGMPFLTTLIYSTKLNGDLELAGAQSVLLLLISVLFFILLAISSSRRLRRSERKGVTAGSLPGFSRSAERWLIWGALLLLALEVLPVLTILLISFAREGSWTWQFLPEAYTMTNYLRLFTDPASVDPIVNSVSMSLLAAGASVWIGFICAYLIVKGGLRRMRALLDPLLTGTVAIPGTVVAIFLIMTFSVPHVQTGGAVLVGTFWILPLAYVIRTYPFVLRSVSSSLDNIDNSIVEAASMFGSGSWTAFRYVIIPMVMPGILAGALLVTITALGEFPSSVLLYTHANRPISIEILSELRGYNFGGAGAYSILLLLLVLLVTALSRRGSDPARRRPGGLSF